MALLFTPLIASAMTISPPTFDYDLNPGDTVLDVVKVYNEGDTAETLYPILVDFTGDEEEGGAPVLLKAEEDALGAGLKEWIAIDPQGITVGPQERINFPFSLNVPTDAQPGGHYGAIILSNVAPKDVQSGVGVSQQLAALILVNVSGEVREVGSIAEFGFADPQVWYNHLPVDFFLRFENGGNTHLRPVGNLLIEDWMGRQVASIKVNEGFGSVLPLSIRRFTFGWQKTGFDDGMSGIEKEYRNFAIGKHTATLVLNYGRATNQVVTQTRTFYVWPWRLMIVGGAVLIALCLLMWWRRRSIERRAIKRYEEAKRKDKAMSGS